MTLTNFRPPTPITQRLAAFFNIEPGEEKLIGLLILLHFIFTVGTVFLQSMAFSVFIAEYGVTGLPYSYISIALIASLVALLYIRIGGRVPFAMLLLINFIFITLTSLLVWLALSSKLFHLTAFILPLWFQTAINLGNIAVWSLAGSLYDFRQGKRLFPLLGAGNWLANIFVGPFIPALVKAMGAVHLMLLAAISFGMSIFILQAITRGYLKPAAAEISTKKAARREPIAQGGVFKDRYVLLIFAYVIVWWVSFFFVDNMFYDRAFAQFPDANQLTAFVGQLLAAMGILALITSTVVSSRVIARFGIRAGLGFEAVLVTLSVGAFAFFGTLGNFPVVVFVLIAFTKLVNVALGFSLSQSATVLVYQALPDTTRRRIQATAEGVLQPIAIGVAGLGLLGLTSGLKFTFLGLSYVYFFLGAAWLVIIFLLSGRYVQALTQAITKRRLGDSANALADPASVAILRSRLQDAHPGAVIYALNKLEALDENAILAELPTLIRHPAPEVRREAFLRVENLKIKSMVSNVQNQLAVESDPAVKESALRALGAIAEDKSQLIHALNESDINSMRGALIGLLKYGDEPSAGQKLDELLASSSNADRLLAIEVMGVINRRERYPQLIRACDSSGTSRAAGLALAAIGEAALSEIESAWSEKEAPPARLSSLAKVIGRIGGKHSQTILVSRISESDDEVRSHILNALSHSGYRTKDNPMIQRAVQTEVEQAARVSAAQVDLGDNTETALLQAALNQFHVQIRDRVLSLSSFLFDGDSIRRVREALTAGSVTQVSYALEIIDAQLPAAWKKMVMPLLENLSPQERSRRLGMFFPQIERNRAGRLQEIAENKNLPDWIRACAMYAAGQGEDAMLSTVEKVIILKTVSIFSKTPDNVLAEMADLLEEVDVSESESVFIKGEPGDSLYVIVDGKVRVHDGERVLNYLGERDVFGEMALLDPEPRSATVTAIEPTRLFRLDQSPFYELMEERPEIAAGIIRVLTNRLRNRMDDIVQLDARLKALEGGGPA